MKSNSIEKEFEAYNADKKEIEQTLNDGIVSYANDIKTYLGENILQELSNPKLNKPIKHSRKHRIKQWWDNMKIKLNNYFF